MSKTRKKSRLILARRVLTVLAALLLCVTLFSGYLYFFQGQPIPPEHQDAEPLATDFLPIEPVDLPPEMPTVTESEPAGAETVTPSQPGTAEAEPTTEAEVTEATLPPEVTLPDIGSVANTEETTPNAEVPTAPVDGGFSPVPGGAEGPQPLQDHDPATVAGKAKPVKAVFPIPVWGLVFWCSAALLVLDLVALLLVNRKIRKLSRKRKPQFSQSLPRTVLTGSLPGRRTLSIGTLHQPGCRQYQQDSLGHSIVLDGKGILAVVADGMGGLKDGDKVSQQIVLRTLELGATLQPGQENGALYRILNQVNEDVNRTLTPEGLYKCGSTMIAVLVQDRSFQWISVGDSRIYLYRAGYVNRLNRDHDLLQEWMPEILSGQRSMEASLADPNARKLTSFIGMGRLKYVDGSAQPIELIPGDRLVLMSDGVYGEVPEDQIAAILKQYPDVRQAANALGQRVQANQNPHQDNYTALILAV